MMGADCRSGRGVQHALHGDDVQGRRGHVRVHPQKEELLDDRGAR